MVGWSWFHQFYFWFKLSGDIFLKKQMTQLLEVLRPKLVPLWWAICGLHVFLNIIVPERYSISGDLLLYLFSGAFIFTLLTGWLFQMRGWVLFLIVPNAIIHLSDFLLYQSSTPWSFGISMVFFLSFIFIYQYRSVLFWQRFIYWPAEAMLK